MTSQREPPQPPDGGFGWVVMVASFLNILLMASSVLTFAILFVEFIDVFNVGYTQLSMLGNVQLGFSFMFNVCSGSLVNRFGCRAVAICGSIVGTIGLFTSSLCTSITMLFFTYGIITGIGLSLNITASIIIVQLYFTSRRALAAGISICGLSVAGLITAPLTRLAVDYLGWRGTMMIHAGILLHCAVFSCAYRPLQIYSHKHLNSKIDPDAVKPSSCARLLNGLFDWTLWKNKRFVLYLIANTFIALCNLIYPGHVVNFGVRRGLTRHQSSWFPTYLGIASLISRLLFSFISNLPCVNRILEFSLFNIIVGVIVILTFLAKDFVWIIVHCCLFGFFNGAVVTVTTTVLGDLIGMHRIALAHGMISIFMGISAVASSPLTGYILDETGQYDIAFAVLGASQLFGGIISLIILCFPKPLDEKHAKLQNGHRSDEAMEALSSV